MDFEGYLYKFNLNASHSVIIDNVRGSMHSHTFVISLFVKIDSEDMLLYDEVERKVSEFLSIYSGKELNKVKPFDKVDPILENIGDFFFDELKDRLKLKGIFLNKLEISETPARVYVVNHHRENVVFEDSKKKKGYDNNIKTLIMKSLINSTTDEIIKDNVEILKRKIVHKELEETREKTIKRDRTKLKVLASALLFGVLAVLLSLYMAKEKGYPWGIDTYGHIFKADFLYRSLKDGNMYPLFTKLWYNGIQPFRYWAPFPYYIFALLEFLTGGNVSQAYIMFIGLMFFVGAFGWLLWGNREKRVFICFIFGVLWFLLPENIRIFFFEGNIPRVVIAALIPYLFYFLWGFVEKGKKASIIAMAGIMLLIIMCHLMVAAMLGITTFIFLLIYAVLSKKFLRSIQSIAAMLLCFAIAGIWLYPALKGGLVSMDTDSTSEVMRALSTPFTTSLDPLIRLTAAGRSGFFYYGVSIFVISCLGIFLSNKKSVPGFLTVIIVFLGTTTAFVPVLLKLPLNQLLWMMRFTPIAYGLFIMSLINWGKCKKVFMAIFLSLIILDSSLSFNFVLFPSEKSNTVESIIESAKKVTNQRIALLDSSMFGSYPSFYIPSIGKETAYSYGWAWQGASTSKNIVLLNTALENGYYNYMFDRSIEMGCDTVVIRKASLEKKKSSFKLIDEAAKKLNYFLYNETVEGYVYHRETPKTFGVVTKYYGISIGRSAEEIPLEYTGFKSGASYSIDDYRLEELQKYKIIYLSGFNYKNKAKAENMISKLSKMGIKVVIDMNRIPSDETTNRMSFLGVTAQPITFDKKLPDLFYENEKYVSGAFKKEYTKWNTVYLQNVSDIKGFSWIKDKKLTFMGKGTGDNKNITFVGFNLMFHAMTNEDNGALSIMDNVMGSNKETPTRTIVPLNVKYSKNSIVIDSRDKDVNTTLAFLDSYKSKDKIYSDQNLLKVGKGKTEIQVTYPYLAKGMILSLMGILGFLVLIMVVYRGGRHSEESN
ncbi:6-pyruvoyl-tetrahydropterin synthase-related protein [Clostridium acetobutylicum]|uniref:6-carboxy-5,6,7,8-tetrahydropterin synthase n=1 Tax=Clostridium acetobutylicum (strain ATCC 824 / DSM 792 / JCM 1419 / IAM 19013 / LMG 5710 / NBRC 13948 / NRRL B-527 / VKM B-1787 / 2291 / W) TaxID=272562 RepID=Q97FY2_CLOAB|nr:6-pyruvoyl-tetrahydropterin synthase-related protein [Clostridium acetobutylicum]AAK80541.1 6-pyruvoyl-tetrahydropterin synthase related domain; conserved membrane protein [Clostridium acetobutylicum ATCC 824]